jgi:Hint domain
MRVHASDLLAFWQRRVQRSSPSPWQYPSTTAPFIGNYTGDLFILSRRQRWHGYHAGCGPCYRRGTRIRMTRGERAVEESRIGDLVLTASDEARPVR